MAINGTSIWRVRAGGDQLNGGGYDAAISGAGTDYTDQDSAQLSLTDLACANNTTLTSTTGGFTSAMIGNCIRISAGTNFTPGYYFVTAYSSSNSVTLDRNPTNGGSATGGTGRLGGAFATMQNFRNGGDLTQPAIAASGLVTPGMTIYIRGSGTDDPANGSPDYDHDGGYSTFPHGSLTLGSVKLIGYNGRPCIHTPGLFAYSTDHWVISNIKFVYNSSGYTSYPVWIGSSFGENLYIENGGYDSCGWDTAKGIVNSRLIGTGTALTNANRPALGCADFHSVVIGNFVKGWRCDGILLRATGGVCLHNVIKNVGNHGCRVEGTGGLGGVVAGNTFDGCGGDAMLITTAQALMTLFAINNIFSAAAGYGLNVAFGSTAANDLLIGKMIGYNNFHSNTSGARANISARTGDLAVDPLYEDAASDDYRLQASSTLRGVGFPVYPYPGMTG